MSSSNQYIFKINNLIFLIFFLNIIISCSTYNNEIYYSEKYNAIVRCNGNYIANLTIASEKRNEYYYFKSNDEDTKNNKFYFSRSNKFEMSKGGVKLPMNEFKLTPNTTYKIRHGTEGHKPQYEIEIVVDENGKIIKSTKTNCN